MKYFSQFPIISYGFGDDDLFLSRNIFIRLKFLDYLKDNENLFEYYVMNSAERPDVIAHKVYGNSNLFWVVLMCNDVIDPKEWLMDSRTLDQYVKTRYTNPYATSHTERNGEVADIRSAQIALNQNPFRTIDSAPNEDSFDNTDPAVYFPVSYYDKEETSNDAKRIIKVVKPYHINNFLKEVGRKLAQT